MKQAIYTAIIGLALAAPLAASAHDVELSRLGWLAGCWAAEQGEAGSVEHWLPLAGGTMLGVARTVKDGKTVAHEFLQIRSEAEGKVIFIAQPSGQKEARFAASKIDGESVVFENPAHDFPQRIIYKRGANGELAARIEGLQDGKMQAVDFPMNRVQCGEPAGG